MEVSSLYDSTKSSVLVVGMGVLMLRAELTVGWLYRGGDDALDTDVMKVEGLLGMMWDMECGHGVLVGPGRVDVDSVVDANGSRLKAGTVDFVVLLSQIAIPSMMQGPFEVGQVSEGSVGSKKYIDVDGSSTVCVMVVAMVLVFSVAAASVVASSGGEAMVLVSSASRAKVKQREYIVELNLIYRESEKIVEKSISKQGKEGDN
jgi:hypothetical protein